MSSAFQLTITPLKPTDVPAPDVLLEAGRALIEFTAQWKEGKSYHQHTVKTFHRAKLPGDGAPWHARLSEHTPADATFDEFWSKLGKDKAENEMNYVHDIKKVTLLEQLSPTQSIWSLYYTFQAPVSPRVFTVLQTVHLDETAPRSAIIVSVPIDTDGSDYAAREEHGVRGRYVSVERLKELPDGKVEWRMATSSTPGGSIPAFLAERSLPVKISDDVPLFLTWLHKNRTPTPTQAATAEPTAASTSPAPLPN